MKWCSTTEAGGAVPLFHYLVSAARASALVLPATVRRALCPAREPDRLSGVNEWATAATCPGTPVVLVHGTDTTMAQWADLVRGLRERGHTVFALHYGKENESLRGRATGFGTGHVLASAGELAEFVDRVLEATGATQVDIVGHSQGGLLGHVYIKWLGGDRRVDHLVTLGTPVHGTSPLGPLDAVADVPVVAAGLDALLGPSAREQLSRSPIIQELSETPDAVPGVRYTAIATRHDQTVRPPQAQFLQARGGVSVTNRWVQDLYPGNRVDHADLPADPDVIAMVLDALADRPLTSPSEGTAHE